MFVSVTLTWRWAPRHSNPHFCGQAIDNWLLQSWQELPPLPFLAARRGEGQGTCGRQTKLLEQLALPSYALLRAVKYPATSAPKFGERGRRTMMAANCRDLLTSSQETVCCDCATVVMARGFVHFSR